MAAESENTLILEALANDFHTKASIKDIAESHSFSGACLEGWLVSKICNTPI
ncbi:hypothetical protein CROQUDRAFT_88877 [Cronartium quercuum f. sp. fusiforme G11]|uniref:Uncharacterized protein n=1 Tax=Cronartium quercuum f. sp. fusiforme G11 TaxID=708437 RepID=A0A9P6TF46_9BASI|nr:hypothetical protein CROQUDRAFT_88877 [Cronartium quercuum f. sp. fusiforme G11]